MLRRAGNRGDAEEHRIDRLSGLVEYASKNTSLSPPKTPASVQYNSFLLTPGSVSAFRPCTVGVTPLPVRNVRVITGHSVRLARRGGDDLRFIQGH